MHGYHGSKQWGAAGSGGVTFCELFSQRARRLLAFLPSTSTLCFVTTERSGERRKSSWRPTRGDAAGEGCRLTRAVRRRCQCKKKKKTWITWINRRSFFQNMRSKAVGRRLRPQDGRGRVRPREVTHRHQSAFAEVKGSALSAPLCGTPLISRRH